MKIFVFMGIPVFYDFLWTVSSSFSLRSRRRRKYDAAPSLLALIFFAQAI